MNNSPGGNILRPQLILPKHSIKPVGNFKVIVERNGKEIYNEFLNGVTTVGLNAMLNVMFQGAAQSALWYSGLISGGSFTGVAPSDTMASHTGWVETANYTEVTRPQWSVAAATAKVITNASNMTFTINTDGTQVAGIFIVNNNTKSGSTGILWSTGLFPAIQTFLTNDLVKVQYSVTLAS